jgi:PBP1b-binding outer membrane lipoprotein LpoB
MVSSLYDMLKNGQKNAYLDVAKIQNLSSEHIDTSILANEIVTNLIKKRIKFLDRTKRGESLKEIQLGQSGMIEESSAIPVGKLKSPNYILSGDVNDNVVYRSGNRIQFLVITLKLTSVSTSELVWQEQQEFLKSTPEHRYSF